MIEHFKYHRPLISLLAWLTQITRRVTCAMSVIIHTSYEPRFSEWIPKEPKCLGMSDLYHAEDMIIWMKCTLYVDMWNHICAFYILGICYYWTMIRIANRTMFCADKCSGQFVSLDIPLHPSLLYTETPKFHQQVSCCDVNMSPTCKITLRWCMPWAG